MSYLESNPRNRKLLIVAVSAFAILAVLVAFIPLARTLFFSHGVKTEGINESALAEASTDLDGTWTVTNRPGPNQTSAGYTFDEVLPGERRTTSGSTQGVHGSVTIEAGTLTSGEITVDMTGLKSDADVRDESVRRKIFHTDEYPESTFTVTEPVDLSAVPDDGSMGSVELTGEMTIHGTTQPVTQTFNVARSGEQLLVAADLPIHRADYGVETPELVAAKIAEDGEINVRLDMRK